MSELKIIIAKNLIELRKRKKYTQADLAGILQYSDKTISKWEKGESLPDVEVLYEICNLYGVTLDFLTHEGGYEEKLEYVMKPSERRNRIVITLIFEFIVLLFFILIFIYNMLYHDKFAWPLLIWTLPACSFALIMPNKKWGSRKFNIPIYTTLTWTGITAIYLHMIYYGQNFWVLYLLGIPIQAIIILCNQLRYK